MYVAEIDTTTTTVELAFFELIRYPIVIKKAQEEVQRVIGNQEKVEENDVTEFEVHHQGDSKVTSSCPSTCL